MSVSLSFSFRSIKYERVILGFGNLGGVLAGFSFRAVAAPRYFSGHGLLIGTLTMSTILCTFMHLYLVRENARRDADMKAQGLTLDDYTEEMKYREREKGDNASVRGPASNLFGSAMLMLCHLVLPLHDLKIFVFGLFVKLRCRL